MEANYGVMEQLGSHVDGRSFLFLAMNVNRTWRDQASRVLWEDPPVSALANPELSEDQRKRYATYIRQLHFAHDDFTTVHWIFGNLRFTQLRYIDIDHSLLGDGPDLPLGQYIQGQLRHLKLRLGRVHHVEGVVDLMATRCPNLESVDLRLHQNRWPAAREHLINLLDGKSLKTICILDNETRSVDVGLFAYLARYNSLEELTLRAILDAQDFINTFNDTANEYLFRNLHYFCFDRIDVACIPLLVSSLRPPHDLVELRLALEGDSVDPLQYISELKSLQVLCIEYKGHVQWPVNDIRPLRELKNLVNLQIFHSRRVASRITCLQLTDQDFASVFETKPSLQRLHFEVQNNSLTVEAFASLGRYCPQLTHCALAGVYDLHTIWRRGNGQNHRPHFPQLRSLALSRLVPPPGE